MPNFFLSLFVYIKLFILTQGCTYKGAVYEHVIQGNIYDPPREFIKANLKVYQEKVFEASKNGVKIIVFPEYGLTGYYGNRDVMNQFLETVPNVINISTKLNPCSSPAFKTEDHQILYTLSCAAKENNIFIVANLGELSLETEVKPGVRDLINITPCNESSLSRPPGGNQMLGDFSMLLMKQRWHSAMKRALLNISSATTPIKQYNTDVVFDSQGNLVAKYRKCHLCGEDNYDYPSTCDLATFDTPFAGLFGIFTCFDVNWKFPAIDLINKYKALGLRNVVFPTMWPDILPFITAIGVQSSYAVRMNVNLLASNVHTTTLMGERGSGIYAGMLGALNYTYTPLPTSGKLLISDIPCSPPEESSEEFASEMPTLSIEGGMGEGEEDLSGTASVEDLLDRAWAAAAIDHFGDVRVWSYNRWSKGDRQRITDIWINRVDELVPNTRKRRMDFGYGDKVAYLVIPPPQNESDYKDLKTAQQCFGELCCTLTYRFARPKTTPYNDGGEASNTNGIMVLGAYDQLHPDFVSWYLRICAFTQCPTPEPTSCGYPTLSSNALFSHFNLAGNFSGVNLGLDNDTTYVFPILLADGAQLPNKSQWKLTGRNTINAPLGFVEPILSAALWGRVFDKDTPGTYQNTTLHFNF